MRPSTSRSCRRRCTTPPSPTALAEACRIVVPGGRVLVLDLREHDQEWVTERLGDRWQGFSDDALQKMMTRAGLTDVRVSVGATAGRRSLHRIDCASGQRPASGRARTTRRDEHQQLRTRRLPRSIACSASAS